MHVLCEISTKGRYHSTLPLTIASVANQTEVPDELVIFDDGEQIDLRKIPLYEYLFRLLDEKKIDWKVVFGERKGQHFNHERAQEMAKELVWRIDDDEVAEPNVLEKLKTHMIPKVGAVAGLVLTPPVIHDVPKKFNTIETVNEINCQWTDGWTGIKAVEHLYSSFLYRKGIADYELFLSKIAHREETIFTHEIFRKGHALLVDSSVKTWHFRYPEGGIREETNLGLWEHDEKIFQEKMREWGVNSKPQKQIVLDNGVGDHIVFKTLLPDLKKKYDEITLYVCYPEIFEDSGVKLKSIAEAKKEVVDIDRFNVYRFMGVTDWNRSLEEAYRTMYL